MTDVYTLMADLTDGLSISSELCERETLTLLQARWKRLRKNFYNPKDLTFDTSKIPDIFDYVTYDVTHNQKSLANHDLHQLFDEAERMASFVVPSEYGVNPQDKLVIGSLICEPLIRKLQQDIRDIACDDEPNSMSLYFSSESHLHSLLNVIRHGYRGGSPFHDVQEPIRLHYLTHIVLKVWENLNLPPDHANRFQIEVLLSCGANTNPFACLNDDHLLFISPMVSIHNNLSLKDFDEIVDVAAEMRSKNITPSACPSPEFPTKHPHGAAPQQQTVQNSITIISQSSTHSSSSSYSSLNASAQTTPASTPAASPRDGRKESSPPK